MIKNLTIRMRLILLIAFLSVLLAGIGGAGLYAIDVSNDALQTVYTKRTVPMGQLGQIRYLIASNRLAIETTLVTSYPEVHQGTGGQGGEKHSRDHPAMGRVHGERTYAG